MVKQKEKNWPYHLEMESSGCTVLWKKTDSAVVVYEQQIEKMWLAGCIRNHMFMMRQEVGTTEKSDSTSNVSEHIMCFMVSFRI